LWSLAICTRNGFLLERALITNKMFGMHLCKRKGTGQSSLRTESKSLRNSSRKMVSNLLQITISGWTSTLPSQKTALVTSCHGQKARSKIWSATKLKLLSIWLIFGSRKRTGRKNLLSEEPLKYLSMRARTVRRKSSPFLRGKKMHGSRGP